MIPATRARGLSGQPRRRSTRWLGPGPDGGLIVDDLAGRGRLVLLADYLARHADYGWASTIDAAQGATADIGIVLVRSGLDREHLYVAMTRGRHANHACTPDPTNDDQHHGPSHPQHGAQGRPAVPAGTTPVAGEPAEPDHRLQSEAMSVLPAALTQSGAQDAAHTALQQARAAASQTTRRPPPPAETDPASNTDRNTDTGRPGHPARPRRPSTPGPLPSSSSGGPNGTSSAPSRPSCTAACNRPAVSSSSCRAGRAVAAAR